MLGACASPAASTGPAAGSLSQPAALLGAPGPLPPGLRPVTFGGTPLLVANPSAWGALPAATKALVLRRLEAHASAEQAALRAHDLRALGLPAPLLRVMPAATPSGAQGSLAAPLRAAAGSLLGLARPERDTSPLTLAVSSGTSTTTTYGGPGNATFTLQSAPYVQTYYNCTSVNGFAICTPGTASGWVAADPEGVIVNSTAAAGIAGVETNQWLGVTYTARAPRGSPSAITVNATVATQDETGAISAIGVSCAPLTVYTNYPIDQDYPSGNQQQANVLASCLDTVSVSIPVFDAGEAASAGAQAFTQTLNALNDAGTVIGLLNAWSGTYNVTSVNWSGLVWGGQGITILVDPYAAAIDAGAGSVVNVARSIVTLQVTDVVGGGMGGGCNHCHPEQPGQPEGSVAPTGTPPEPWIWVGGPYLETVGGRYTFTGQGLGSTPGAVLVRACSVPGQICPTTTLRATILSWSPTSITVRLPPLPTGCSPSDSPEPTIWAVLPDGQVVRGSQRSFRIYC